MTMTPKNDFKRGDLVELKPNRMQNMYPQWKFGVVVSEPPRGLGLDHNILNVYWSGVKRILMVHFKNIQKVKLTSRLKWSKK